MARLTYTFIVLVLIALTTHAVAQAGDEGRDGDSRRTRGPDGPRGFGGPTQEDLKLVEAHDLNGDGWLNQTERAEARKALTELRETERRRDPRGRPRPSGRPRARGRNREPAVPGPRISPNDVENFPDAPLYEVNVLRTIFLNFENDDWEAELQDFYNTDVEVPATMVVDGKLYPGVGVRFRGKSSYMMVPAGYKRSFNVSIDLIDQDQRLYGYKTLNLLNCAGGSSMMSTVLYTQMADEHLAVPKANFVKVVVNGEYWGVYTNVQQFDKIFTKENFGSSKGTRWKVPGSPRGDGGLTYNGNDLKPYKVRYDMKSNDGTKAWYALVELCRVLNETPMDRLVEELSPILDIDETLWFLAFDVALVNSDGYWTRASDYCLFRDKNGLFHLIPYDLNEAFSVSRGRRPDGPPGPSGPGMFGPPSGDRRRDGGRDMRGPAGGGVFGPDSGGVKLDPLVGLDNERIPLRSRLLAVPALRERYMECVHEIAEYALNWERLSPQIAQYRALINNAVQQDTRKLESYESFLQATSTDLQEREGGSNGSLQSFAHGRRSFLLNYQIENPD